MQERFMRRPTGERLTEETTADAIVPENALFHDLAAISAAKRGAIRRGKCCRFAIQ
jgi:hypothetical protein